MNRTGRIALGLAAVMLAVLAAAAPCPAGDGDGGELVTIRVARGDSLSNICGTYLNDPSLWRDVARINAIKNPNLIHPGQTLSVPESFFRHLPFDGVAAHVRGDVRLTPKGSAARIPVRQGYTIAQGSTVRTGQKSAVEITFADGSVCAIGSETTLGIGLAQKRKDTATLRRFRLAGGTVMSRVSTLDGESQFVVNTPAAVAGVRGTHFAVGFDAADVMRAEVLSGSVSVGAQKTEVVVGAGQGTVVKKGEPPAPPKTLLAAPRITEPKSSYELPAALTVAAPEGATAVEAVLARDSEFRDPVVETTIPPAALFNISGVAAGSYFVRLRAVDAAGLKGLPSPAIPVALVIPPPPLPPPVQPAPAVKPVLTAPIVSAPAVRKNAVTFSWKAVAGAAGYRIQASRDPAFSRRIIDEETAITSSVVVFTEHVTYYVRIAAFDDGGTQGPFSTFLFDFTTGITPIDAR